MKDVKGYVILVLFASLIILLIFCLKHDCRKESISFHTDTITIHSTDTVIEYKPLYFTKKIIDTIFVYSDDSTTVKLPIEQKYYKKEGSYEAWVSGYMPSLDKINVFNRMDYQTITNTVTLYKNAWRGYISADFSVFSNKSVPSIEFTLTSPKKLYIKASIGLIDNEPIYGIGAGIRIFEK